MDGIFSLVTSSKKGAKSLSLNFLFQDEKLRDSDFGSGVLRIGQIENAF